MELWINYRKKLLLAINQVTAKLEHFGDETLDNLSRMRVLCLNVIPNVATTREDQNDQDSTQGPYVF
jgi:hypothetical protein